MGKPSEISLLSGLSLSKTGHMAKWVKVHISIGGHSFVSLISEPICLYKALEQLR